MTDRFILVCKELSGNVPPEIQVIPAGYHDTPKGPFNLDAEGAQAVIAAFEAQSNDMVVDYEHQTLADPPVEAPAAGWIKRLINKGPDGIWAAIEWTERAKQYVANKEYRYVSPVFLKRRADNKVIRLINVALTNQPNIDGMVPITNKLDSFTANNKEADMKGLLKLLGLAEDAKEDAAIAAVNKLLEAKATAQANKEKTAIVIANKGVLDALGLAATAGESEVIATINAMKQSHTKIDDLVTELSTLKTSITEKNAAGAVEAAINAGKITPAQKDWATDYAKRDLPGFEMFVSKAPVVVVAGQIVTDKPADTSGIDDTQAQINKMCGISDETFKKHNPQG